MSKCINCKYLKQYHIFFEKDSTIYECEVCGKTINFPRFMGGFKKCECYEKREKIRKEKFEYPKKVLKEINNER